MSSSNKLDDYKKEIRSLLIPYQKGCHLSEFNRSYREFIGRRLPFRELGFGTDVEFLYSIPDVVKITPTRTGDYHLLGIADEKSKHIQKMVARQKPAKLKPPSLSRYSKPFRSYILPPRFSEERKVPVPKIPQTIYPKEPAMSSKPIPKDEPKLSPKVSPQDEVISLIQHFNNRLAIDDLLCEYQRMYHKCLSLSKYGFSSIEECVDVIPELEIVRKNNVTFVQYHSESPVASDNEDKNVKCAYELSTGKNLQSYDESSLSIPPPKVPSTFNSEHCDNQSSDNGNIPKFLREKLQKVAERFPEGIWASDFPAYFEEVTGNSLELGNLGYRCLSDLIDDVPGVFVRKPVAGSRKDYIIYSSDNFKSAGNESLAGSLLVDHIVLNLRKILEAYPEGIRINQVLNVYSINCKDSLHIKDFGFDDLETFLSSIKNRVPLRFDSTKGEKSIHLVKLSDGPVDLHHMAPEACDKEAIPFDAVFPEFVYKSLTFPPDCDFSKYIPAYTSSVAHAGHIYIQLQGEETQSQAFIKMAAELDNFYNGNRSEQYMMKNIHIKVGASCVAKWPVDQHWYRAEILSIPSMQNVLVHYIDYGTKDTIPMFLLRYAKKEFIDLSAQAIRCRLAFLKPPKNAEKWGIQTRNRILEMCEDVPLMAKIEEIGPDGVYSILLCDTNGEEDVYINDVLRNEGLADYDIADPNRNISVSPEPKVHLEHQHNLDPLPALQAQFFLQAFAAVAPSFARNEHYIKLLKQVSLYCQNSDSVNQTGGIPYVPPVGPPGFNSILPSMNTFVNSSTLYNAYPGAASMLGTSSVKKPKSIIPPPVSNFLQPSSEYESSTLPLSPEILLEENADGDNEIFDDDDDEMFQQFCQKVSSTNIRYVKRVNLGDGYKIHVVVVESKPYASSGDISQLIWNNKEADYLLRRLQVMEVDIPAVSLSEDGNEELFQQLLRFNVKGVQKTTGFKSSIVLYPLKTVIKILNLCGHPSVTLRTRLTEEITNFNPNDPHWSELSPDNNAESDDEDSFSGVTDDDKIERLCLFDLLAMKESITCKRKKMLSNSDLNRSCHTDEIDKLEQLHQKVLQRITEIKEICKVFA